MKRRRNEDEANEDEKISWGWNNTDGANKDEKISFGVGIRTYDEEKKK